MSLRHSLLQPLIHTHNLKNKRLLLKKKNDTMWQFFVLLMWVWCGVVWGQTVSHSNARTVQAVAVPSSAHGGLFQTHHWEQLPSLSTNLAQGSVDANGRHWPTEGATVEFTDSSVAYVATVPLLFEGFNFQLRQDARIARVVPKVVMAPRSHYDPAQTLNWTELDHEMAALALGDATTPAAPMHMSYRTTLVPDGASRTYVHDVLAPRLFDWHDDPQGNGSKWTSDASWLWGQQIGGEPNSRTEVSSSGHTLLFGAEASAERAWRWPWASFHVNTKPGKTTTNDTMSFGLLLSMFCTPQMPRDPDAVAPVYQACLRKFSLLHVSVDVLWEPWPRDEDEYWDKSAASICPAGSDKTCQCMDAYGVPVDRGVGMPLSARPDSVNAQDCFPPEWLAPPTDALLFQNHSTDADRPPPYLFAPLATLYGNVAKLPAMIKSSADLSFQFAVDLASVELNGDACTFGSLVIPSHTQQTAQQRASACLLLEEGATFTLSLMNGWELTQQFKKYFFEKPQVHCEAHLVFAECLQLVRPPHQDQPLEMHNVNAAPFDPRRPLVLSKRAYEEYEQDVEGGDPSDSTLVPIEFDANGDGRVDTALHYESMPTLFNPLEGWVHARFRIHQEPQENIDEALAEAQQLEDRLGSTITPAQAPDGFSVPRSVIQQTVYIAGHSDPQKCFGGEIHAHIVYFKNATLGVSFDLELAQECYGYWQLLAHQFFTQNKHVAGAMVALSIVVFGLGSGVTLWYMCKCWNPAKRNGDRLHKHGYVTVYDQNGDAELGTVRVASAAAAAAAPSSKPTDKKKKKKKQKTNKKGKRARSAMAKLPLRRKPAKQNKE